MVLPLLLASVLSGQLCIGTDCREVSLEPAPVVIDTVPADHRRTFTVAVHGTSDFILGEIPIRASRFTIDSANGGTAVVRVSSRHGEPIPPLTARVATGDGAALWNVSVRPDAAHHELTLRVASGTYDVMLQPARGGMKPARSTTVTIEPGKRIELPPWNWVKQLRGTVHAADRKAPLPDAEIIDSRENLLATTNTDGEFVLDELEPEEEPQIGVRAAGFGSRWIPLPNGSWDLGVVELFRGSTLSLYVEHPAAVDPLPLEIVVREDNTDARQPLREARGTAGQRIELTDLPPGRLRVTVSGPEPLQRYSRPVEVAGDAELRIPLEPVDTRGLVTYGDEALSDALLKIEGAGKWRGRVTTDENGEFAAEMWDRGDLMLTVTAAGLKTPYVTLEQGVTSASRLLDIQIPATILRGRVYAEGKALPAAKIRMRSVFGESASYSRSAEVSDSGEFEVAGLPAGSHEISAIAEGYLKKRVEFSTEAKDEVREVNLELERGHDIDLKVRTADGRPAAGAVIAIGISPDGVRPERNVFAGEDGTARLTLVRSETKNIFAVDRLGRFAQATVSADRPRQEEIVSISPGEGAIELRVIDTDGRPVSGVGVIVRHNGVLVPHTTLLMMLAARNTGKVTDVEGVLRFTRLPAGRYELFAWANAKDLSALLRPGARQAPVDVMLDGTAAVPVTIVTRRPAVGAE